MQEKWILIDVHKIDLYLSPVSETATIRKLNVSAFDRRKSRLKRIIINSFRGHFMKIDSRLDFENLDSFLRDHPIFRDGSKFDKIVQKLENKRKKGTENISEN